MEENISIDPLMNSLEQNLDFNQIITLYVMQNFHLLGICTHLKLTIT